MTRFIRRGKRLKSRLWFISHGAYSRGYRGLVEVERNRRGICKVGSFNDQRTLIGDVSSFVELKETIFDSITGSIHYGKRTHIDVRNLFHLNYEIVMSSSVRTGWELDATTPFAF